MRLSDFIVREAIITHLEAATKEAAIGEIVRGLHHAGCFRETDQVRTHATYRRCIAARTVAWLVMAMIWSIAFPRL